jgi:hypothetical protein
MKKSKAYKAPPVTPEKRNEIRRRVKERIKLRGILKRRGKLDG